MRLTLAWLCLCLCLAIYCGGQGNGVLSLPPSLIATATEAAALRQPHRWKKDARVLFDSGNDAPRDMRLHSKTAATSAGKFSNSGEQPPEMEVDVEQQPPSADFNQKALSEAFDLGAPAQARPLGPTYTTPLKYWERRCQGRVASALCPREYYRAMLAARNKEALRRLHMQLSSMQDSDSSNEDSSPESPNNDDDVDNSNEVFMLLTGEQELIKFLRWAMQLLYPFQKLQSNLSDNTAEFYHPSMFIWKKLNLSGHLEPPLVVDEPRYVLVRREKVFDGYHLGGEAFSQEDDPFIPPRGRKHNSPDLGALFNRYETFVPNRGKRDQIKDLFKYDDLFFPNRGKKHRNIFQVDDPFFPNRGKKFQLRDLYNVDDPFFPNRGKRHLTGAGGKLNVNWPQRMSTHKLNGYDQSVKPSMSREEDAAEGASRRLPANRLHSTRSMSAKLQQQRLESELDQLQQRVRFIVSPAMRQQVLSQLWSNDAAHPNPDSDFDPNLET